MPTIHIADMRIQILPDTVFSDNRFWPFVGRGTVNPDVVVYIQGLNHIRAPQGNLLLDEQIRWIKEPNGKVDVCLPSNDPERLAYLLHPNSEWNLAHLYFDEGRFSAKAAMSGPLFEIMFRNRLILKDGVVLHASAIACEGKGILFSAPSQTGKTTQAGLWGRIKGASLINNDRPAIRLIGNKAYAYGTPWSGLAHECYNRQTLVSAIVMLEQAPINSIRKLESRDALLKLMPRCFLPYHDAKLMSRAMQNIEKLIYTVPIYLLQCRPDQDSVELTYNAIWRNAG